MGKKTDLTFERKTSVFNKKKSSKEKLFSELLNNGSSVKETFKWNILHVENNSSTIKRKKLKQYELSNINENLIQNNSWLGEDILNHFSNILKTVSVREPRDVLYLQNPLRITPLNHDDKHMQIL